MKLRIKGNSIRLRLGQSEVRQLATEGVVEEFTDFGPAEWQRFGYALHATFGDPDVIASFADGRMVISLPADSIHRWACSGQIGIDAVQLIGGGRQLQILVEKDFECIDAAADESQADAFPNPQRGAVCAPAPI
jgi:hypothetical protein